MTVDYERIKEFAKANNRNTGELIALARKNDPFYFGTEGDKKKAEWAKEHWQDMGSPRGVHPRRIHYYIVSKENPTRYNGKPYKNVKKDWNHLTECLKAARYLGKIPISAISDERNPAPQRHHTPTQDLEYNPTRTWASSDLTIQSPKLAHGSVEDLIDKKVKSLVERQFDNVDYSALGRQPYMIEIWCEKSTMTDVLKPIVRKYSVNLQEGKGEVSITMVKKLIDRVRSLKRKGFLKPVRIFYISDYDPHGDNMPKSMARKIEYFVRNEVSYEVDIKVKPLALTEDQCRKYELSTTPVSDERYLDSWGVKRTELDALEAQHPGLLAEIVENAVEKYYDPEMREKVRQAEQEMRDEIENEIRGELEAKKEKLRETREKLAEALENIRAELEEWKEENKDLIDDYNSLFNLSPSFDGIEFREPKTNADPVEGAEWFFDSQLDYFDQLEKYKERWG